MKSENKFQQNSISMKLCENDNMKNKINSLQNDIKISNNKIDIHLEEIDNKNKIIENYVLDFNNSELKFVSDIMAVNMELSIKNDNIDQLNCKVLFIINLIIYLIDDFNV